MMILTLDLYDMTYQVLQTMLIFIIEGGLNRTIVLYVNMLANKANAKSPLVLSRKPLSSTCFSVIVVRVLNTHA